MAWYDANPNWMKEAVNKALELEHASLADNAYITKKAEASNNIGIGPGAVVGTILGYGAGKNYAANKTEAEYRQMYGNAVQKILNEQNQKLTDLNYNHYQQIENIDKDLKVIFSPVSVAYMLKGTVVDTISVDLMTASMKNAWAHKDSNYFRNLLLNKVYMESQMAEQLFMKHMIETDKNLRGAIAKQSSIDDFTVVEEEGSLLEKTQFINPLELIDKQAYFNALFKKAEDSEPIKTYINTVLHELYKEAAIDIPLSLDAFKFADDSHLDLGMQRLAFLGFGHSVDKEVMSPRHVIKNFEVSYLPDRVVFVVDNVVIGQLNSLNMSEDAYDQFQKGNERYFRNYFVQQIKRAGYADDTMIKEAAEEKKEEIRSYFPGGNHIDAHVLYEGEMPTEETIGDITDPLEIELQSEETTVETIEKEATIAAEQQLFLREDIHPKVYFIFMNKEFGDDWLSWDFDTLETMIKINYNVDKINDIALNKLTFIITLFNSDSPITGYHTFEKLVRTFNNKPFDFNVRESNISLAEIVNTLRIATDILADKDDNIYDDLSEHVLGYITEVLVEQNYRVCVQKTRSKMESDFWGLVNVELTELWSKRLPEGLFDTEKDNSASECLFIQKAVKKVCEKFKLADTAQISAYIDSINPHKGDDGLILKNIIVDNAVLSMAVDSYLENLEKIKEDQIKEVMNA